MLDVVDGDVVDKADGAKKITRFGFSRMPPLSNKNRPHTRVE